MELFGVNIPVSALIGAYLTGMVLVGYPMGKWSLKAWKYPEKYPLLGKVLFPDNSATNRVGTKHTSEDIDGTFNNLPITMDMFDVHDALRDNTPLPLAKYIVVQMMIWPVRVAFTVIACTLFFFFSQLGMMPTYGAKLLMHCKKCTEI